MVGLPVVVGGGGVGGGGGNSIFLGRVRVAGRDTDTDTSTSFSACSSPFALCLSTEKAHAASLRCFQRPPRRKQWQRWFRRRPASGSPVCYCDTTSTPLWRNGPRGPKSLCNACGIRFKKEERRATAAAATSSGGAAHGAHLVDAQHMMNGASWAQPHKTPCYSSAYGNEFRFIEDDVSDHHRDSETGSGSGGIPFLSWRFNVTDRPSLVHDFTR
ncbi:GATA transcription factor 18 [Sesamum angolense]|uniref:GATA transcription factor 18 n=1 Tax=Sesamum angolense TaxID=2727404 RepID=A0AAE1XEH2_9LAMI|nr:GATA transcription factor 18 [Sesamum angolense]